jgi:hypothetical protein
MMQNSYMTVKDAKNNNKENKNRDESSSLPFEIMERATQSNASSAKRGGKKNTLYVVRRELKQLSAQKNLMRY